VPIGVPGELCLGGDGLARGYVAKPDLTARRFVADPFGAPGSRLYRTGDRARWRPDGTIEYLGRLDEQVKIRGHRVEPAEIEAALRRHHGVADAAVAAREDGSKSLRLLAYLVGQEGPPPPAAEIRAWLRRELPEYLIPSSFVSLPNLPLTPSGKLDRRALPAVDASSLASDGRFVAPRDDLERRLVEIWEVFFDMRPIGIDDDFFYLGGHSLLGVRLISRMEEALGVEVAPILLLRAPTIAQLAAALRDRVRSTDRPTLVSIQQSHATPPFFCIPGGFARGSVVFGHGLKLAKLARRLGPGQSFYSFYLERTPGTERGSIDVEPIAARFLRDLLGVQPKGPYFLGGYSFGGLVALEMARQLQSRGESIGLLALFDTGGPGYPRKRHRLERLAVRLGAMRQQPLASLLTSFWPNRPAKPRAPGTSSAPTLEAKTGRLLAASIHDAGEVDFTAELWQARDTYLASLPRYPGPVTLFRASEKPDVVALAYDDPFNGWRGVIDGAIEVRPIHSQHATLFDEPALTELAQELRQCLREAASRVNGCDAEPSVGSQ
jgi:thioesterase domain-containing protein